MCAIKIRNLLKPTIFIILFFIAAGNILYLNYFDHYLYSRCFMMLKNIYLLGLLVFISYVYLIKNSKHYMSIITIIFFTLILLCQINPVNHEHSFLFDKIDNIFNKSFTNFTTKIEFNQKKKIEEMFKKNSNITADTADTDTAKITPEIVKNFLNINDFFFISCGSYENNSVKISNNINNNLMRNSFEDCDFIDIKLKKLNQDNEQDKNFVTNSQSFIKQDINKTNDKSGKNETNQKIYYFLILSTHL